MHDPKIKIYVACHKDSYVPENSLLFPIQVGCKISNRHIPNMLHDDLGDNISERNRMYCELTAQYWAWKNDGMSDYIGFFHYRRYLNFSGKNLTTDYWGNVIYNDILDEKVLAELGIESQNMQKIISKYDVIVPASRIIPDGKNIYDQYINARGQHKEDLDCALSVLSEKYPEYSLDAKEYMSSNKPYEVNMFIMKRELFESYAEWLFNILFEVERRSELKDYNQYELRVMGFLSERLFGIWFTHNCREKNLKILELQKTLFQNTDRPITTLKTSRNSVVAVLACSNNYVPYLAVMLQSIVQNARQDRKYEIYILMTDVSQENQNRLRRVVEIDERFTLACVDVKYFAEKQNLFVHMHISVETYYRFFILDLFRDTEKVLYLDCDMAVNADIADLYDTDISGNYLAAVKDIDLAGSIKNDLNRAEYVKKDIGCIGADEYFQAGVLLLNLPEMRKKADMSYLLKVAVERNWSYMDQDILNHVYQKKIKYLNQSWNCLVDWQKPDASRMAILKDAPFTLYSEYLEARQAPKIIHYAGPQKPWLYPEMDFAQEFWEYAKNTSFYEMLLYRMSCQTAHDKFEEFERGCKRNSPDRLLKGFFKCLRKNGILYTVKYIPKRLFRGTA